MRSLCFPTCRKLCIAQHPHFPTDSDTGKLVTQGYFAHFYSDSKLSVTCYSSEVEMRYRVCFNYSQPASLTNGCLSVSLLLNLLLQTSEFERGSQHTCRSFGVKHCAEVWKPFRIRPNQFWLLQEKKKKKKKKKKSPTAKSSCQNK